MLYRLVTGTGFRAAELRSLPSESFDHDMDKAGRVADFHAFRHTYVSMVVQGGASVKVAQELARHSTPMLTIGRYAHASLDDQFAALTA